MKTFPISVLHVVHWPKSGIVSLLKGLITHFDPQKVISHVIFFENNLDTLDEFRRICASVHTLDYSKGKVCAIIRYRKLLNILNPDVLHTHSFLPGLWGRIFLHDKTKLVCTLHNMYPYFTSKDLSSRFKRTLEFWSIKRFSVSVICVSHGVYNLVNKHLLTDFVRVIENGIDLNRKPTHFLQRTDLGLRSDDIVLVSVGRLDYQKGYDILLTALCKAKDSIPNLHLIIVGDGSEKRNLLGLIQKLKIVDRVQLVGYQPDPFPYLVLSDIYVSSSRFEGFGLSVAEAMLSGLPVIATNIEGTRALVRDGKTGIVTEQDNPLKLAQSIIGLLRNESFKAILASAGKTLVLEKYSLKEKAQEYEKTYQELFL
jgi:glycosyltransferase involved in cell wall biosynthesis